MAKHRKYFRAFNGKEAFDEPLTKNPGDYEGHHRQTAQEGYLQSEHLEWLLAGKPKEHWNG